MSISWTSLFAASASNESISGPLDVNYIVEQIINGKKGEIKTLETYETLYNAKKSAFQELNTLVSAVESSLYSIKSSGFSKYAAASSDTSALAVSASTTAGAGNYSIIVGQLARAQSNTSAGLASSTDLLLAEGTTFSITQGGETETIDITGQTRSLSGLKSAINQLDLDVNATLVYDGANYKLQVTSTATGAANAFTIDDTSGGAVGTAMATPKLTALDAEIYVNSPVAAENKITRSGNVFSDVIPGLTMSLRKADAATTISVDVTSDTASLRSGIEGFVSAFNSAVNFLNTQFTFNEQTGASGALSGESAARKVQLDLMSIVSSRVQGIDSGSAFKSLATAGLTLDENGNLVIDDEKLDAALTDNLDDVKRLFVDVGTSSASGIDFVGRRAATRAGTYGIHISQLAEQAMVQGSAEVPGGGLAGNETLTVTYGGSSYAVELTAGMSLNQVISAINTEMQENNVAVFAAASGNTLQIGTEAFGSAHTLQVVSNLAAGAGGTGIGTTPLSDTGVDVAGTIGGRAASGKGQVLTSTEGDANGLMVLVTTSTLGDNGTVNVTFGVGEQLRERMYNASLPYQGLIANNITALDSQLENISDRISAINSRLAKEQETLIKQFTQANEALVQLEYLMSALSNSIGGSNR